MPIGTLLTDQGVILEVRGYTKDSVPLLGLVRPESLVNWINKFAEAIESAPQGVKDA